jgi:carotenoid cleavage dioxygenase
LLGSSLPRLERWRLCPGEVRVNRTIIDDLALEFPVTDRAVQSHPYAHAFAAQLGRRDGLDRFPGYVKYDLKRQTSVRIDLPEHLQGSEPLFVRANDGRGDDEGYLLCVEYDRSRDQSDLVIYDAHDFRAKPEARIQLPVRIPFGFHGTFLAGVHH